MPYLLSMKFILFFIPLLLAPMFAHIPAIIVRKPARLV